jgi:hypothetical protein
MRLIVLVTVPGPCGVERIVATEAAEGTAQGWNSEGTSPIGLSALPG